MRSHASGLTCCTAATVRASLRTAVASSRRRPLRVRAAAFAALLVAATTLAGCAAARNELGTVNSECYITLHTAIGAVHHQGKLDGVRLVGITSLRPHAPILYRAALAIEKPTGSVCLVAFGGDFTSSSVDRGVGDPVGHVAVVELSFPGKRLIATLVLRRPPIPFGHFRV